MSETLGVYENGELVPIQPVCSGLTKCAVCKKELTDENSSGWQIFVTGSKTAPVCDPCFDEASKKPAILACGQNCLHAVRVGDKCTCSFWKEPHTLSCACENYLSDDEASARQLKELEDLKALEEQGDKAE